MRFTAQEAPNLRSCFIPRVAIGILWSVGTSHGMWDTMAILLPGASVNYRQRWETVKLLCALFHDRPETVLVTTVFHHFEAAPKPEGMSYLIKQWSKGMTGLTPYRP
jgi:hypothetical protein